MNSLNHLALLRSCLSILQMVLIFFLYSSFSIEIPHIPKISSLGFQFFNPYLITLIENSIPIKIKIPSNTCFHELESLVKIIIFLLGKNYYNNFDPLKIVIKEISTGDITKESSLLKWQHEIKKDHFSIYNMT